MSFINDIFSGIEKILIGSAPGAVDNVSKSVGNDLIPGDVEIVSITLMSEDQQRSYSLMAQCKTIEIFESVTSPTIFAELGIADAIGLYESFPILGEEYVSIEFRTPKTQDTAKYLLRVNNIRDKVVKDNGQMVTYTMQLVSAELIRNSARYVNKTYEKNISDVVKEILNDDLSTEKPISIDKTSGIEKGNITRMQPFKAIDFLRRRAVSTEYQSSSFVFFESRDGYKFTTLEKLITDGQKAVDSGATDKEFFFDGSRKENIKDVTFRNIISYNQVVFGDTISKVQHGGMNNEVNAFDLITGGIKKITLDPKSKNNFKPLDKNGAPMNTSTFDNRHGKTTANKMIVPVRSDLPATTRPEKISIGSAFAESITQNIVRIHIYGDTEIRIGDVIKCSLPVGSTTDKSNESKLISGNYLVTKVRHIILNTDRPQHTIAIEMLKGNLNS